MTSIRLYKLAIWGQWMELAANQNDIIFPGIYIYMLNQINFMGMC